MAAELVPGVDLLRSTPVLLSLGVLAALTAAAVVLIFQKTSNQMRLRETNNRIQAHLLELRLYRDEPAITWRAQKALLRENLRRLRLLLAPMLITAPPIALLIVCLDAFYGRSPLPPGHAAVVTVKMRSAFNPDSPLPALAGAAGVAVETPPVRIPYEREISWRIRPLREISSTLQFTLPGETLGLPIEAGRGPRRLVTRASPKSRWVDWIEIKYPRAAIEIFGFDLPWLLYFSLVFIVSALGLKHLFRVVLY